MTGRMLRVVRPGPYTTTQDLGRPGHAHLGVSESGAFDRAAHALGQRLLGNPVGAAGLEITVGPFEATALANVRAVVTGGFSTVTAGGRPVDYANVFYLSEGETLSIPAAVDGLRVYLSVDGGFEVRQTLASRSADSLSGLGPEPLVAGDLMPIGRPVRRVPALPATVPVSPPGRDRLTLHVLPGPRVDWLADVTRLVGPWRVSSTSNRVGVRLEGEPLRRSSRHSRTELPSEGLVRGAVQLPPNGQPVVFGPDHPTTGGYPVVAVLTEASTDALAQARPGQEIVLKPATGLPTGG